MIYLIASSFACSSGLCQRLSDACGKKNALKLAYLSFFLFLFLYWFFIRDGGMRVERTMFILVIVIVSIFFCLTGLHQRWWDACVSWRKNPDRISSVGFVMDFTKTPESYLFVRTGSNINSVNDIRTGSSTIGELYDIIQKKNTLNLFQITLSTGDFYYEYW